MPNDYSLEVHDFTVAVPGNEDIALKQRGLLCSQMLHSGEENR